jgi:hypothetical protein
VHAAFDLRAGEVQNLAVQGSDRALHFHLTVGGVQRLVAVEPYELRSPDFQFLVDDGVSLRSMPSPDPRTMRGTVAGHPDSIVAVQVIDGQVRGTMRLEGGTFGIAPVNDRLPTAPRDLHIVYCKSDLDLPADLRCGTPDGERVHAPEAGGGAPAVVLSETELALDLDYDYFLRKGSDRVLAMQAAFGTVNSVDAIYQADVQITYKVSGVIVREGPTYTTSDLGALLGQFQNRWISSHGNIRRDVAHLFTGVGSFSGVIGIAYLSVVCSTSNGYGVSKAYADPVTNAGLVCHELGHNWSAPHCDGSNPCNIMCSGLGGCSGNLTTFGPVSAAPIVAHRNSRTCLTSRNSGPPGSFTRVGVFGCIGSRGFVDQWAFGFPRVGHTGYYRVTGAPGNANAFLAFGLSDTTWSGLTLPFSLSVIGSPCLVYNDHVSVLPGAAGALGNWLVTYTYPSSAAFIGRAFFTQFYVIDLAANQLGLTTSNGFKTLIGA